MYSSARHTHLYQTSATTCQVSFCSSEKTDWAFWNRGSSLSVIAQQIIKFGCVMKPEYLSLHLTIFSKRPALSSQYNGVAAVLLCIEMLIIHHHSSSAKWISANSACCGLYGVTQCRSATRHRARNWHELLSQSPSGQSWKSWRLYQVK